MIAYLSLPGYAPVEQAADLLSVSRERVLQYIRTQRLPAQLVAGRYLIPLPALHAFQPQPHGRVRTKAVPWRSYRTSAVYLRQWDAPLLPGCECAVQGRLCQLAVSQQHCIAGTLHRFVRVEAGQFSILLIWKQTEMKDEVLEREVLALQEAFADLVDWAHGREMTSELCAYT